MVNKEYERLLNALLKALPKRMYRVLGETEFSGFFTRDRLSLSDALLHNKSSIPQGTHWGEKWEYGWFFTEVIIPSEASGKRVEFMAELGESTVFVNGEVYGALDREHKMITLSKNAVPGEKYNIAMEVYAGHSGEVDPLLCEHYRMIIPGENNTEFPEKGITQKVSKNGHIAVFYDTVFQLWMDIKTLLSIAETIDPSSLRKAQIEKSLKKMCDAVNIELPFEEFEKTVITGRKLLEQPLSCKNGSTAPLFFAIGNSHLDLAWLWPVAETRRKTARTLGNQLKIIEDYPEYKYIQSQPWILETVKNDYPDLYEKVKAAVKNGNIVVEGGAWVQPDTNMISGESMIRQFMFGKNFIMNEFGYDSKVFWLPDSFGISASLPQIMKGCGIKYFMNAKILWQYNGGDKFPKNMFMWRGIDGTEILTTITSGYADMNKPANIINKWRNNCEKEDVPVKMFLYGHGDGGGGATREHLEYLRREKDLEGMPRVIPAGPNEYFDYFEKNYMPYDNTFVGELYYAAHRGTYTSQAKTKMLNRKCEFALREAEFWNALLGNCKNNNTEKLWKTVLLNQFHDILPGTSIAKVYEICEAELAGVVSDAKKITCDTIKTVLNNNNSYITVFNSLSWNRKAVIELPDGCTSIEGQLSQEINGKYYAQVEVPPCGCKSFKIDNNIRCNNEFKPYVLENELIRAEFNNKGQLISAVDKECNIEYIEAPSNVFRMYKDVSAFFEAWDIDSYYENVEVDTGMHTEFVSQFAGAVASGITFKAQFGNSKMLQTVILEANSKCIRFETEIDWQETHKLLKTDFNTNIQTEEMLSETQFGYVKRPNHKSKQYDADRFEVCQHKWSALTEGKRGVALLNDCKYGISADGGRMSLSLLKSSMEPALNADKGLQRFTYEFMPFSVPFADCDVIKAAYELNCPTESKRGFADEHSYFSVSAENVIIDTVKPAEDGSGDIIVRLYETKSTYTSCNLNVGIDVNEAYFTDMLENNITKAEMQDNHILLNIKAFEIITLRLKNTPKK